MLNERGAIAITVALCLVLFCGMAALAVDLGFGYRERRFDQSGADSAALGGSLEMVITAQTNPVQAGLAQIYSLVDQNLGRAVPQAAWTACNDAEALTWKTLTHSAALGTTNGSDCVSMSADFNTVRVLVPIQETPTIFGRVMGFNSMSVNAAAEAERNTNWGGGGDFPSGVLSGTQAGATICIKTGTSSASHESCGSPSTGDFGNFKPYFYSEVAGSLASLCVSGEQGYAMSRAMADGIDHQFSAYNMIAPNPRINGNWCQTSGVPGPPFPNMVDSAAGYHNADITNGLIAGGSWITAYTGRLTRGPYVDNTAYVYGFSIDNRPLWEYIDPSMSSPASCLTAAAWGPSVALVDYPTARQDLLTCIIDADASGVPIFTTELFLTHRIAHAPLYWETNPLGSNSCCYHIKGLVPIFIDGVWARATHNSFSCAGEFDDSVTGMCTHLPGLAGSMNVNPPGQKNVDSASAIVLSCAVIPPGTCPTIQDGTNPLNFLYDLQLIR